MLDAALAYAAQGRAVFPCRPGRKTPATRNGHKAASTDPTTIEGWWDRQPDQNVAVATGRNLLVVDCDEKADVSGVANFFALTDRHGTADDIDTFTVETPSGGGHYWFELSPDVHVLCSAGKLADGVDIRAAGGYVVAPPSRLENGAYRVFDDLDVRPAPTWLLGLLAEPAHATRIASAVPAAGEHSPSTAQGMRIPCAAPAGVNDRYGLRALDAEADRVASAPVGQRNDTLVRAAFRMGQLAGGGVLDPVTAADRLHAVGLGVGLDERETERTIRSGLDAGLASPRKAPL